MSKKTPKPKERFFNIDKAARKYYPTGNSQSSKDSGIPVYVLSRSRKSLSSMNRGIFSINF